jgi:hypothetical protein
LNKIVILSLSLLLLILIPGCFTFQVPSTNPIPPVGTPPVIIAFSNNPATINAGGTSTLLWNVTGATSVSIDNGIGQVDVAGTRVVSPAISTVYTISATNYSGTVTRSAVTTVNSAPLPPAPIPFSVTSVTANADPSTFTGVCPKTFTFYATITANGSGTVSYRWERNDGRYSDPQSVTFYGAGTKTTTIQWDLSGSSSGWYRVHVLAPNDVASDPANYILNCAGASLVTSIVMSVDPNTYTGACPVTVNFWATITANGPGPVTYRWERSDNATAMTPQTIIFASAGTQTIATTWTRGGGTGWQRLHVLTPNDAVSSPIGFTLTCAP